jgi:hypothetical protein
MRRLFVGGRARETPGGVQAGCNLEKNVGLRACCSSVLRGRSITSQRPIEGYHRPMDTIQQLDRNERERIRLQFFHEHCELDGFSSVSVRPNREKTGWCVSVGVTDDIDLPGTFAGLPVVSYRAGIAVPAVAYPTA